MGLAAAAPGPPPNAWAKGPPSFATAPSPGPPPSSNSGFPPLPSLGRK
jgi:hypothetical protein